LATAAPALRPLVQWIRRQLQDLKEKLDGMFEVSPSI
jgi:hypothetical protein